MTLCDFYFYKLIGKLTVFFVGSGVQFPEHDRDQFHYRRAAFTPNLVRGIRSHPGRDESRKNGDGRSRGGCAFDPLATPSTCGQ